MSLRRRISKCRTSIATVFVYAASPICVSRNKPQPITVCWVEGLEMETNMPEFNSTNTRNFRRPLCHWEASISNSPDDDRYDPGHRSLYVLGFGIAGAIFANAFVFIYFVSF